LGHFVLTTELLDVLKASAPSRVVTVASGLEAMAELDLDDLQYEKRKYTPAPAIAGSPAYKCVCVSFVLHTVLRVVFLLFVSSQSKLCNILFSNELARRLKGTGVSAVSLRPGFVPSTNISGTAPGGSLYNSIGLALLWPSNSYHLFIPSPLTRFSVLR
jgi:hypothetical protein